MPLSREERGRIVEILSNVGLETDEQIVDLIVEWIETVPGDFSADDAVSIYEDLRADPDRIGAAHNTQGDEADALRERAAPIFGAQPPEFARRFEERRRREAVGDSDIEVETDPAAKKTRVDRDIEVMEVGDAIQNEEMTMEEGADALGTDVEALALQLQALAAADLDQGFINQYGEIPTPDDYKLIAEMYAERSPTGRELRVNEINALASYGRDDILNGIVNEVYAGRSDEWHHIRLDDGSTAQVRQSVFDRAESIYGLERDELNASIRFAHQLGIPNDWGYIALLGMTEQRSLKPDIENQFATGMTLTPEGELIVPDSIDQAQLLEAGRALHTDETNFDIGAPMFADIAAQRKDINTRMAALPGGVAGGFRETMGALEANGSEAARFAMVAEESRRTIRGELRAATSTFEKKHARRAEQFQRYLTRYGGNRYVAMIAATFGNTVVADQVWENDGPVSEAQAEMISNVVFGGNQQVSPEELDALGIDINSQDFALVTQPPAEGQKIFFDAPDGRALREAHNNLFKAWFGTEASETELAGFVGEINGALEANARARVDAMKPKLSGKQSDRDAASGDQVIGLPTIDPQAESIGRARSDPRYQELFGKKREDQTEEAYIGEFTNAAADLFGARSATDIDARLAGQRTGDTDTTTGRLLFSQDVAENDTFIGRAARLVQMIERMT